MKLFSLHRYVSVDMETLLTLQEIAKQLKRLADAWEGEKSEETKDETDPDDNYNNYWTDADIEKAIALYNEGKNLQEISDSFPSRTPDGVYCALLRRGINVRKSTKKNVKYPVVPKTGNGKRPYHRQDGWTPEEDAKIVAWVTAFGNKWTELSKALPGRTIDAIQSRWHKHLRKLSEK